ncbi:MAG: SGNH/GDSL hydrolase family protein [Betaproteobacteria bacterium]
MPAKRKNRKVTMATPSRAAPRAQSFAELTLKSVQLGRKDADRYIAGHKRKSKMSKSAPPAPAIRITRAQFLSLTGQTSLVAKGDSWFNYIGSDILRVLARNYHYNVDGIAATGARIVQVANDGKQLDAFCDEIARQVHQGNPPKAVLLSGGGNDIADNFEGFLYHRSSAQMGWNDTLVDGFINGTIKSAYAKILAKVDSICTQLMGHPIPILIHGYANPVPDGRGIFGNWLMDGFWNQGYVNLSERTELAKQFIGKLNTMQSKLKVDTKIGSVLYVDLRPALSSGPNYKADWTNELHPTPSGFEKVTKLIADALSAAGVTIPQPLLTTQLQTALGLGQQPQSVARRRIR